MIMKRGILAAIFVALAFLLSNCNNSKKEIPKGFVYLEDGVFKIDGEVFFPLMVNYRADFRAIGDDIVASPTIYYEDPNAYESDNKDEIREQMSAHFELIKSMGFNSLRICADVIREDENGKYYHTPGGDFYLKNKTDRFIESISDVVSLADSYGLKVMILLKPAMDAELEDLIIAILQKFADNRAVFAFDMMNEPLYFDTDPCREKKDAVKIVARWRKIIENNAPNHLFTIGFSEPIEVFEWDPAILPVDFIEIHTYNPLRIPNEIWWYSHYVGKPWMIGETSLPADNDAVSYDLQARFVEQAYQFTIDCGGIGFGWWEFQDYLNPDMNFEANYPGLLNHDGVTVTESGRKIIGTMKPAAYEFARLHKLSPKVPVRSENYFNMLGYENYVTTGRITCNNKPVEGAVIRGWNAYWGIGMNTYSDENGCFTLYSNDKNVHFEISAPRLSKVKFDSFDLEYVSVYGGECDFSTLQNVDLEYHKISYFPFLANDTMLFEFKPEAFNKAIFKADLGDIELKEIK